MPLNSVTHCGGGRNLTPPPAVSPGNCKPNHAPSYIEFKKFSRPNSQEPKNKRSKTPRRETARQGNLCPRRTAGGGSSGRVAGLGQGSRSRGVSLEENTGTETDVKDRVEEGDER